MDGNQQTQTPHMDNFADKAMVFDNAHCPAPLCSPSRTAVMSGVRPSTSGIYNNSPHFRVSPVLKDILTIPEYFAKHGDYFTSARGKIFHNDTGQLAEKNSWADFQEMTGITMNNHKNKTKNMLVNPIFSKKFPCLSPFRRFPHPPARPPQRSRAQQSRGLHHLPPVSGYTARSHSLSAH